MVEFEVKLVGVGGGRLVSISGSVRSSLFPTSSTLRFGDARARASLIKGCRPRNEACEVRS